jgi:hypothetical protein
MNRFLALFCAMVLLAGCKKPEFLKSESEKATPVPLPTPAPAAASTPQPNWMWKNYKNPLDSQKPKR